MDREHFQGLSVLVVEDDPLLQKRIGAQLEALGADVTRAGSLQAAREFLKELDFDFVLLDVNLPDGQGTSLLTEPIFPQHTRVVVMTAYGAVAGAVEAMRNGAADYLVKPFDPAELPLVLKQARQAGQAARREEHQRTPQERLFFGESLAGLRAQLEKILTADRRMRGPLPPVLIQGETGTGKTTMARWLHENGPRALGPLVEVNCSALPESLAESELFGHERGAFTDARSARMGLFEAADGGTLLLDELPSLSLALQAKVLTVIEDRKVRRVGSTKPITVDVRVVAATNQDLRVLIEKERFREDLYHRLDLYRIQLPPLRDRAGDIPRLADRLMGEICRRHGLRPRPLSEAGKRRLGAHPWPGNVRELAHELERALVFEEDELLHLIQLGPEPDPGPLEPQPGQWLAPGFRLEGDFSLEGAIDLFIHKALQQTEGNVSAAARLLSVPRDYIRYRMRQKRGQV